MSERIVVTESAELYGVLAALMVRPEEGGVSIELHDNPRVPGRKVATISVTTEPERTRDVAELVSSMTDALAYFAGGETWVDYRAYEPPWGDHGPLIEAQSRFPELARHDFGPIAPLLQQDPERVQRVVGVATVLRSVLSADLLRELGISTN